MCSLSSLLLLVFLALARAASSDFGIPSSNATVSVKRFNVGNITLVNLLHTLVHPILPGHESATIPMYSFLVEHGSGASTRRLMFDLGLRKDPLNLAPSIAALFATGDFVGPFNQDITDLLGDAGIALSSIESVIWSHSHFDHIGDMSKWPNSTSLVIGSQTDTSTYPQNASAALLASDFAGRTVTEIDFFTANLTFNSLSTIDYFGDGSFYLVNTPGHLPGHLTAFARVTANPSSFIILAGDTFHHAGEARPRPLFQQSFPCPAHLLAEARTAISTNYFWSPYSTLGQFDIPSRAAQLLAISDTPDSYYADPVTSQVSLEKIALFDADEDFFVLVTHDFSVVSALAYYPEELNGWKTSGWKQQTVWSFVDAANPAFVFSPTTTNATA
ncbi:hypothetical protein B0H11DRAFT_2131044 [Mycena galericulata]|nr:hypothetical protein B0H11DRAFT_2131044 [Mycena galericulata]